MNRQPPCQRPHRNQIPDPFPHNRHRNKIHLRRLIRNLPVARPPRRPHHKPSVMPRRRRLHLHLPHPPRHHDQVILLVIAIRLGHHKSPARRRHHKLHLRQIPPILGLRPSPRFPTPCLPFPHCSPLCLNIAALSAWMYVGYVGTAAPGCPPDRARHEFRVGPGLRPGQAEQSSAAPSPHATQIRPKQKWRSARLGRRATNFSLYFQNIKSKGANRTFLQLYIPPRIRDLARNTHEKGLDKIPPKVLGWPIQAAFWLER